MSTRSFLALVGLIAAAAAACARPADQPAKRRVADVTLVPDTVTVSGRVSPDATLASLFRDQQLREDAIPALVTLVGDVFDLRQLKAHHDFELVRTRDGLLRRFKYHVDEDRFLRVGAGLAPQDGLRAELVAYEKEHALVSIRGEINDEQDSLFAAMDALGERPELSLALADIFGGEIDFNSDLQPGDGFTLTFEKVYREGQFSGYGDVVAAQFENDGRVLKAIRFTPPGGKPGYYDEQGRSLRRFFLASPLKFILSPHVTSRYSSSRYHPVLRIYRPHLGVDYRAPYGSPVVAVAAGAVVSAGWSGQGGRMVRLRHASGYETLYMHLSSIAVRAGTHVGQGQLIGRVGATGVATGAHLDYRVRRNGRPMNPQTLLRTMPPGEPIQAAYLGQFRQARDVALSRLVAPLPATLAAGGGQ